MVLQTLAYCLNQAIFAFHSNHPLHAQNKTVRSGKDMELTLKSQPKPLHFRELWNSCGTAAPKCIWWNSLWKSVAEIARQTYEKEICRQNWSEDSQTKSLGGKPCSCEVTQPICNTLKIFHTGSGAFQLASPCGLSCRRLHKGTMSVHLNTSTKKRSHKNDSALHPDILSFTPPTNDFAN